MDSLSAKNPTNNPRMDLLHSGGDLQELEGGQGSYGAGAYSAQAAPEPAAPAPAPAAPRTMPSLVNKAKPMDLAPAEKPDEANTYVEKGEAARPKTPVEAPIPEPRHVADIQTAVSPPSGGRKKVVIISVVLLLVLLAAGTGAAWWMSHRNQEQPAPAPAAPKTANQTAPSTSQPAPTPPAAPVPGAVDGTKIADGSVKTTNTKPVFTGTSDPGNTIALTVNPEGTKLSATADNNGSWSISSSGEIPVGTHQISLTSSGKGGTSQPTSFSLVISAPPAPAAQAQATPVPAPAPAASQAAPAPAPAPAKLAPTGDDTRIPTLISLVVMVLSAFGWYKTRRKHVLE